MDPQEEAIQLDKIPLDELVAPHHKALESRILEDSTRLQLDVDHANDLRSQFYETGEPSYLEEAISFLRKAPQIPLSNSSRLHSLAMALHARFRQTKQHIDLNEAVDLLRQVSALISTADPNFPAVRHSLAIALLDCYQLQRHLPALEEAIQCHRDNLKMQSALADSQVFESQSALAEAVFRRYERAGDSTDLNEAVTVLWRAIEMPNIPNQSRAMPLRDLANALNTLFSETGELVCMEQAIGFAHEACIAIATDHPVACSAWFTLGELLEDKYSWTRFNSKANDPTKITVEQTRDVELAAYAYHTAAYDCTSSPISQRFSAARVLAKLAFSSPDVVEVYGCALEAYQTAMELLPSLTPMHLDLESRQRAVAPSDGLALEAVTCAIRCQKYDMAIQFLEAGRSIFWSLALQLRTPLQELEKLHSDHAQRLHELSVALEEGARRDLSRTMYDSDEKVALIEHEAARYRRYNGERDKIIEEVRLLDGFRDFLRQKPFSTLQKACAHGPVVILIDSERQSTCSALILKDGSDPAHLILPITILQLRVLVNKVRMFPGSLFPLARGEMDRHVNKSRLRNPDPDVILREVLRTLWDSVVQPILRSLGLQKSESPPRLWWLPTGVFTCLQIHAAGIYHEHELECVSDFVISSYTPTLGALLVPTPKSIASSKMMVVIDRMNLRYTSTELENIEGQVPGGQLVKLGILDAPAHAKDVLKGLETASIVHFACHGTQDMKNPLESALHLPTNRALKVSSLMQLSLQNSSLAFLSACQTAMGGGELPDESRHLAATFLFCGFRGVIGTMWAIEDPDGPVVAESFYRHLFLNKTDVSNADTTRAACALHLAVTELRKKLHAEKCPRPLVRWLPFIHIGL